MNTFALIFILMLPGMEKADVTRQPMVSLESCLAKVAELHERLKSHIGEAYAYQAGCEVTGTKADPA